MLEPSEPFTRSDAAEADARHVRDLVLSRGYQDFYAPFIIGCINAWYKQLADPSVQRAWKRPDDYLRGAIQAFESLLRLPNEIIEDQVRKNAENEQDETVENHYNRIALEGRGLPGKGPIDYDGQSPSDPI